MKKTLALVLALLMVVVALVGCSTAPTTSSAPATSGASAPASVAPAGPLNVAVEIKATESDFWQYLLVGADQYAKAFPDRVKVTTYGPQKETDTDQAVSILEQIIQTKPDGIVLASTSSDATVPACEEAYDQGIIMIIADNKLNTDKYNAFLATNNLVGGALAADTLVEGMTKKGATSGTVLVVSSTSGSQVINDRQKGFLDQMKSKYPQYKLYPEVQYCENDIAKALSICENVFAATKDIVGVFGVNNMSGDGVARYVGQENLGSKVAVVCYDSDPEEIKAINSGNLYAMVIQDPAGFGYKGIDLVYQIKVKGYKVEDKYPDKYIDTGCTKITKDNIADPKLAGLIDPYKLKDGTATRDWGV